MAGEATRAAGEKKLFKAESDSKRKTCTRERERAGEMGHTHRGRLVLKSSSWVEFSPCFYGNRLPAT